MSLSKFLIGLCYGIVFCWFCPGRWENPILHIYSTDRHHLFYLSYILLKPFILLALGTKKINLVLFPSHKNRLSTHVHFKVVFRIKFLVFEYFIQHLNHYILSILNENVPYSPFTVSISASDGLEVLFVHQKKVFFSQFHLTITINKTF